jgi:hypothetical protein
MDRTAEREADGREPIRQGHVGHGPLVQHSFRSPVTDSGFRKERLRVWAHRFVLVGYLLAAVAAWMLVRKPARSGFVWLAAGATLQLIGRLLQH